MAITLDPGGAVDAGRLRRAVAGQDPAITRQLALKLLAASELPDKVGLLRSVVDDPSQPVRIRQLAATTMYRLNRPETEDALIQSARSSEDGRLLALLVRLLGRIGGERSLEAVTEVRARSDGLAAAQAEFAAALIAHRLGLVGHDLPDLRDVERLRLEPGEGRPLVLTPPDRAEARLALDALRSEPFGITPSARMLQQVRCDRHTWMLVLSEELADATGVRRLSERKSLAALVAYKSEESGAYSVVFLVLLAPAKATAVVNARVHRTTGELAFAGRAQVGPGGARFEISSVARPGVFPLVMTGSLEGGQLRVETARSSLSVGLHREPAAGLGR